tara:strand:- start:328 stop:2184 length:1857 start_codon:yes stop_codon:yes gene_type:complete
MDFVKGKISKIILGLTSAGIILLMFPANLYANHFRYGTMSWEPVDDDGTIRLKMQNGWTTSHGCCSALNAGDFKNNYVTIYWGDGSDSGQTIDFKVLSRDNTTNDTITEMGDSSSGWTVGVTHKYASAGTYVVYWSGSARESVSNDPTNGNGWRNQTTVTPYFSASNTSNSSPVSAVPSRVQVQDNTTFNYQVGATDANNDSLNFRWGTKDEFFSSSGDFTEPTGMTLSSSGLISWDVRDTVLCIGCSQNDNNSEDDLWVAVIMVEDLYDNGSVKSYIPVDFFFRTASASNDPPVMTGIDNTTQSVSIGTTNTFTLTSTDDSGAAPTFSVLNPPSDISSIWSTSSSTSVVNGDNTTTFTITFTPPCTFANKSYTVNIRSTDSAGMTKDQTLRLFVSMGGYANPTAPTLVSPANGSTVVKPVSFQWEESTDADNDTVSYSFYLCTNSGFSGCSGTSVAAGVNLTPPFNQNLQDSLISWPRYLEAAPIYQQISKDLSMLPRWMFLLTAFGMLSILISFSLKNISNRKLVIMLILLIFFFSLNINSCARSDNSTSETASTSDESSSTTDGNTSTTATSVTINDMPYTTSDVTNNTTYYWKVIASDTMDCSGESRTWSFTVQ